MQIMCLIKHIYINYMARVNYATVFEQVELRLAFAISFEGSKCH